MSPKVPGQSRPSIALLIEDITGPYQSGVWSGIYEAAGEMDIDLTCYCGGALDVSPTNQWEYQKNLLFALAEKKDFAGYIISGSIGGYVSSPRFLDFIRQFIHRPVVSLIPISETIPCVCVDNRLGMHELITHLIQDHKYRSFAFIRGPVGNSEAEERFSLFKEILREHGLSIDHKAVYSGDFTRESGIKAIRFFKDQGLHIDVIVSAADEIALGALEALAKNGTRIPQEVALVGFDDVAESSVTSPPLTTLHQPMHEMGKKAVELMFGLLHGDKALASTTLEATLKVRQSCGCVNKRPQNEKDELDNRLKQYGLIKALKKNQSLRTLGHVLANSLEIDLLLTAMATNFPQLGVSSFFCFLASENGQKQPILDLKLACIEGQRIPLSSDNIKTAEERVLYSGASYGQKASRIVVQSLYFQKEYYGLIGFEADHPDGQVYEELAEYVGSALHSALLLEKVHHQTEVLSHANDELNKLRAKEHAYIEAVNRELALGRKIQQGFLPETLPQMPGWEIASSFLPARAVSGDLYDSFLLGDSHIALVIADVVGKDISAALFMSTLWTLIRALSNRADGEGNSPQDVIISINDFLHKHYSQNKDRQMYATLFLGLLDLNSSVLKYCNAGHYPPKIILGPDIIAELKPTGPAVGISPGAAYELASAELPRNSLFCAYTDGVLEARNIAGDFFTAERLNMLLVQDNGSASHKIKQIETALKNHIGEAKPFDDITMLIVKRV